MTRIRWNIFYCMLSRQYYLMSNVFCSWRQHLCFHHDMTPTMLLITKFTPRRASLTLLSYVYTEATSSKFLLEPKKIIWKIYSSRFRSSHTFNFASLYTIIWINFCKYSIFMCITNRLKTYNWYYLWIILLYLQFSVVPSIYTDVIITSISIIEVLPISINVT